MDFYVDISLATKQNKNKKLNEKKTTETIHTSHVYTLRLFSNVALNDPHLFFLVVAPIKRQLKVAKMINRFTTMACIHRPLSTVQRVIPVGWWLICLNGVLRECMQKKKPFQPLNIFMDILRIEMCR